jgi:sulfate adenylyltransferase subunit 2
MWMRPILADRAKIKPINVLLVSSFPVLATINRVSQLNAQRRRAVQLRVDGRSLTQIRGETGLSVPTIISAFKAFTQGGWHAVDVGARGRPQGVGRALTAAQESELAIAALYSMPESVGLPRGLWTAAAAQRWVASQFGVELHARAVARCLVRWGLSLIALRDAASRTPALADWLEARQAEVRNAGTPRAASPRTWWCGSLPAPAAGNGSRGLLVAVDARGHIAWLPTASLSLQDAYVEFLARLQSQTASPVVAWLHGLDLRRAAQLNDWIATQPRLQVVACPIPLARRSAPADEIIKLDPPPLAAAPFSAVTASAALAPSPAAAGRPFITPRTSTTDDPMNLTHLQRLEAESIHIMREVVAETDNPVMLYSIGKDSAVMLHLARKAFYPSPPPFPLLHVDTTWKFRAMYEMRERMAKEVGMDLIVYQNPEAAELGINPFTHGSSIHTDMWKTQGLKQALDKYNFDAAFGGARRDEEKSRAKERIFSFRSAQHRWDPKNQRPELWRLYNGRKQKGESIRVFPISNWTELDIWQYIYLENIPIVPLYFAAERPVVNRDGTLIMVDDDRMPLKAGEVPMMKSVRFRTLGCYPLSGAVESTAATLPDVIQEMLLTKTSERQGRMIDHDSAASMEKKKQEGYF